MLNCSLVQSHLNCLILAWGYQCGNLEKNQKLLFIIILTLCLNSKTNDLVTSNEAKFYYKYSDMLKSEKYSGNNITNQGAHHSTQNTRQGEHIRTERTRVSEWVIKFYGLSRTADSEVHIVHISRVIIACTLKSLSSPHIDNTQSTSYK